MASCFTSDRCGGILAALEAGASTIDELDGTLSGGGSRDTLATFLRELRDAGFVVRSTEAGPPLRVSYRLTEDGRKLFDLMLFLNSWLSDERQDESALRFWSSLRTSPAALATIGLEAEG